MIRYLPIPFTLKKPPAQTFLSNSRPRVSNFLLETYFHMDDSEHVHSTCPNLRSWDFLPRLVLFYCSSFQHVALPSLHPGVSATALCPGNFTSNPSKSFYSYCCHPSGSYPRLSPGLQSLPLKCLICVAFSAAPSSRCISSSWSNKNTKGTINTSYVYHFKFPSSYV